jgi:transposase InsO family protein
MTKKVLLYASNKSDTAVDAAKAFLNNFVAEYGLPDKIISDQDARFTANFWKELTRCLNVQLGMSTAYHPQTDGQTERVNRVVIEMLRTMGVAYRDTWCEKLKLVQFNINNSISKATGFTPFYAFAAFHPRVTDTMELHSSPMQSM